MKTPLPFSKEQCIFTAWPIFLILCVFSGLFALEKAENKRFRENQRRSVIEQLSTIRAKLEGQLNAELLLARSLVTEVVTNTDITQDRFFRIAHDFMAESKHIKNIGLAKGTVLTYVYPVKGNEQAIGFDYRKNKAQWPAVKRTIEKRINIVAGPVNLVQGGIGIIGRTPIYIDSPHDNRNADKKQYFGMLSVVIDLPSLLKAAGLKDHSRLNISIRGKDGLGDEGEVFFGPEILFNDQPVLLNVTLPSGNWQMAARPFAGWIQKSPNIFAYRIGALIITLIILSLLFIQQREMKQRREAEQQKENLIEQLQNAISEVKQLSGLLPICSSCKKIRDDKGYWNLLEIYIETHSDASFSHGICPDCSEKIYGDEKWYKNLQKKQEEQEE